MTARSQAGNANDIGAKRIDCFVSLCFSVEACISYTDLKTRAAQRPRQIE